MTVRFDNEHTFSVGADALVELMHDPRASEERSRRLGAVEAEAHWTEDADGRVHVLREARDTGFPTERFETVQRTRWSDDARSATWTMEQTGGPGHTKAEGTLAITPLGPGRARLRVEGRLTIDASVFTGLVERLVRRQLAKARAHDARLMEEQLAR